MNVFCAQGSRDDRGLSAREKGELMILPASPLPLFPSVKKKNPNGLFWDWWMLQSVLTKSTMLLLVVMVMVAVVVMVVSLVVVIVMVALVEADKTRYACTRDLGYKEGFLRDFISNKNE